ncbi:bacteriophage abortive infection AbiH family protein [Moritella sp. 36]|uniref:bacteriophage abortive infection AbiH family protein n=1 Tax=Moritella sp. 36 TaxID=2746233 RepID=UPI001BA85A5A|nr:bacteriophage abortive infection AbiH family protein [Moritella sp. 36]QUM88847.1 bacteriophage abortive infection AbiH family protein [Moritella sp. 36]
MDRLYIIGNGFDLYHGFSTRYSDFHTYLQEHCSELLELINRYYFLENEVDLWADFEESLANLDQNGLLEDLNNFLPDTSSDDFCDRDWHAFSIEISSKVGALTHELCEAFRQFILSATSLNGIDRHLRLQRNSKFLSFNYSNTLEKHYLIPQSNIAYIHGKANDLSASIVLGHGIDPEEFKVKPEEQPEGLSEEDLERWHEYMSDNYDYAYEQGTEEVYGYFINSFKNTEQVIESHSEFFSSLIHIKNVYILGHSLSEVDIPYFKKIHESLQFHCQWHISYRGKDEYLEKREIVSDIGVSKQFIHMIEFSDLT